MKITTPSVSRLPTSIVQFTNYQWAILIQENLRLNARLGRWRDAAELWHSTSRSLVSVTITISIFACRRGEMGRSGQTRGTMVSRSDVDQLGSMAWAKGDGRNVWTFAWM